MSQETYTFVPNATVLTIKDDSETSGPPRSYKTIIIILVGIVIACSTIGLILINKTSENIDASEKHGKFTENSSFIIKTFETTTFENINEDYHDSSELDFNTTIEINDSRFLKHKNYNNFQSNCGYAKSSIRIQNGYVTDLFEHPWIVTMNAFNKSSGIEQYFCGGSLLSDRIILTASHCIPKHKKDLDIFIVLGDYNLTTDPDCTQIDNITKCAEKVQRFNSSEFTTVLHPKYDDELGIHDIALIRLKRPAKLSQSVYPICLPFDEETMPEKVQVIGFGKTEKRFWKHSDVLLKANMNIIDNEKCNQMYENQKTVRRITDNQFCATDNVTTLVKNSMKTVTVDSCQGDSGSPALWPSYHTNKFVQYGLVSWGADIRCGSLKPPGVYVKLYSYLDWILDNSEI